MIARTELIKNDLGFGKMEKSKKDGLQLLLFAALIGLLGSYSANYCFVYFTHVGGGIYHIIGIVSIILFFSLILLINKIIK